MFFGGPEPAQGGRLQLIRYVTRFLLILQYTLTQFFSIHSGKTTGNIKMDFGKFERARYKKYIYIITRSGFFPTRDKGLNMVKICSSPFKCVEIAAFFR